MRIIASCIAIAMVAMMLTLQTIAKVAQKAEGVSNSEMLELEMKGSPSTAEMKAKTELLFARELSNRKGCEVKAKLMEVKALIWLNHTEEAMIQIEALRSMPEEKVPWKRRCEAVFIGTAFLENGNVEEAEAWFREIEKDEKALYARKVHARHLFLQEKDATIALELMRHVFRHEQYDALVVSDYLLYASILRKNGSHPEATIIAKMGSQKFQERKPKEFE